MRFASAPILAALCLCQTGSSQRTVAAGASVAASSGMGYRSPALGGWSGGGAARRTRSEPAATADSREHLADADEPDHLGLSAVRCADGVRGWRMGGR